MAYDSDNDSAGDVEVIFALHEAIEQGDVEALRAHLAKKQAGATSSSSAALQSSGAGQLSGALEGDDDDESDGDFDPSKRQTMSAGVNDRDWLSMTPLHLALLLERLDCAQVCIQNGARTASTIEGMPMLNFLFQVVQRDASSDFLQAALQLLLGANTPVSAVSDLGCTTLMAAAALDKPDVLQQLQQVFKQQLTAEQEDMAALLAARAAEGLQPIGDGEALAAASSAPTPEKMQATATAWVNAQDASQQTALHYAATVGAADSISALLALGAEVTLADAEGNTAAHVAAANGFKQLLPLLKCEGAVNLYGRVPAAELLAVDSSLPSTLLVTHADCLQHHTAPFPIQRHGEDPPPENVWRLKTLVDSKFGVLRRAAFKSCSWLTDAAAANMSQILRVHEYSYVRKLLRVCGTVQNTPEPGKHDIAHVDPDTAVSRGSFDAAAAAAGAAIAAVDAVAAGKARNAFCAVRPPGHHSGPYGKVVNDNDPSGSHGFCLLNNIAIAAAHARAAYHSGAPHGPPIRRTVIVDFDVHHGNGTEACVKNLVPSSIMHDMALPFANIMVGTDSYKPWVDGQDGENTMFVSSHGFGKRDPRHTGVPQAAWFYSGSGSNQGHSGLDYASPWGETGGDAAHRQSKEGGYGDDDDVTELYEPSVTKPQLINIAVPFGCPVSRWRRVLAQDVLPAIKAFNPDMIFISAGFDAHYRDELNLGYVGLSEADYSWITRKLVQIANDCCDGRIVSVLEGGYRIQGAVAGAFASSTAAHVSELCRGTSSGFDAQATQADVAAWINKYEMDRPTESAVAAVEVASAVAAPAAVVTAPAATAPAPAAVQRVAVPPVPEADASGSGRRSKRSREPVDWVALDKAMRQEEAAAKAAPPAPAAVAAVPAAAAAVGAAPAPEAKASSSRASSSSAAAEDSVETSSKRSRRSRRGDSSPAAELPDIPRLPDGSVDYAALAAQDDASGLPGEEDEAEFDISEEEEEDEAADESDADE